MEQNSVAGKLIALGKGLSRLIKQGLDNLVEMGSESSGKKDDSIKAPEETQFDKSTHPAKTSATAAKKASGTKKKTQKKKTRTSKSSLTRDEIMDKAFSLLKKNPEGLTASQLAKKIGVKSQALPHPLKKLVTDKGVTKVGDYYFPDKETSQNKDVQKKIRRSGLKEPETDEKIVNIVKANPGIILSEIAEKLNKSRQSIAKNSKRLVEEGSLVKKENKYYLK